MDFEGTSGPTLTIDTDAVLDHHISGNVAGRGDRMTINASIVNGANGVLNLNTHALTTDSSWFDIGTMNLGTESDSAYIIASAPSGTTIRADDINFLHAESKIHAKTGDIDLDGTMVGSTDVSGAFTIQSTSSEAIINPANGGSFGSSNTKRMYSLHAGGTDDITVNVPVYSKSISYNPSQTGLFYTFNEVVDGGESSTLSINNNDQAVINFNDNATITTIDFENNDASTINVADGKTLTTTLKGQKSNSSVVAGNLVLQGDTSLTGTASSISSITAGADGKKASIGAGDQSVTEIKISHANGEIEFADGANVKLDGDGNGGAINSTGGAAGTLTFLGSSTIDGTVGTNTAPAEINADGDANSTLTFNDDVTTTKLNIGAGTVELGADFTGAVEAASDGVGTLTLSGTNTITGAIGDVNKLSKINLQGTTTFNETVDATSLSLDGGDTTFDKTVAGNITSTGNKGTLEAAVITGDLNLSNGGTVTKATSISGDVDLASDATITTVGNIGGSATLGGTSTATSTGTIGGNLSVNNSALFTGDATDTDVTGTVSINSDNANANTIHNATGAVTVSSGKLTMNDAEDDVTLTDGTLTMNDATGAGATVKVEGGALTVNDIAGDSEVSGGTATLNNIDGDLTITNDASVNIAGDNAGSIAANAANSTLTFTGTGTSTGSVTATGDVIIQASRTFSSASLLMPQITVQESNTDITLTAADLGVIKAYTTETDRSQDLIVNVEQNIGGTIGTSDNPFGNIILNADVAANIKTSNLYAGITTNTDGEGSVVFATDNSSVLNLGDNTNSLKSVKFSENGTASENVYATNITVEDAKTANFGGDITSTELLMDGATATASFSDSATINSTIEADDDDHGVISFAGSASVTGTIGSTKSLATINANGDANSTVTFSNNTSATKLNIGAGIVKLGADFTGAVEAASDGVGTLTFTDSSAVSGTVGANKAPAEINTEGDANSTVTFSNDVTTTTLNIGAGTVELGADFTGAVEAASDGVGTLTLSGTNTITGAIGDVNKLSKINLQGTTTFNETVDATSLSLDGGDTTFDKTVAGNITSTGNKGTLEAAVITGDLNLSNGGTVTKATSISGDVDLASDATITTVGNIGGSATLGGTSTATSTGTIGGNLSVNNSALFTGDATDTDVTGTVSINSDNANANTIHNATGAVTVSSGKLTMNDAEDDVTLTDGTLTMNDATGAGATVKVEGGALTVNDIAGDSEVSGGTATLNNIDGDLTITNDASVNIAGDNAGSIAANAANSTLTFTGTGTSTGSVTATGDVIIQASRTFSSASLLMPQITVQESNTDITLTAADLGVIKAYTTETDRSQDLIVNVEQNIGGTIGTSDNPFGNIILNADVAANIKTSNLYAGITTNTDGEGSVVFATDNSSVLNLGDNTNSLKSVKFSENGTASENVYATNITVEDAKTANFGGDITSTELLMDGATATASFSDSATINSTIEADDDDHGVISFAGSASVTGTIGSTKSLATINANGDANSTVTFSNNTSATKLNIGAGIVKLGADFTGAVEAASDGVGTLTFTDSSAVSGTVGANKAPAEINTEGDANSTVTFSNDVTTTTLNIGAGAVKLGADFTGAIEAASDGVGTLTFTDSGVVTGTVGANKAPAEINANGDANSTVTFSNDVTTTTLNIGAGTVELGADFTGAVEAASDGLGTLTLSGTNTITGAIGDVNKLSKINLQGTTTFNETVDATSLSLDGGDATFDKTVTSNITSTGNKGTLEAAVITGDLDLSNGGTLTKATSVSGDLSVANDGTVTTIGNIGGSATLGGTSTATSTGTIGGNLSVNDSALFTGDASDTDVTGTVSIDSDNANANTLHNATGAVTVSSGTLTMNDATGAAATVKVEGGELTVNDVTHDLTVTGGTVTKATSVGGDLTTSSNGVVDEVGAVTGNMTLNNSSEVTATSTIGGNLSVNDSALFTGHTTNTDVTGTVSIDSDNANASTLHNASGAVTVSSGKLTMNDAADDVTLITGTLTMNDATGAGATVKVESGTLEVNDVTHDLTVTGGTVTSAATVGGDLSTSNAGVVDEVGAVTGNVTLNNSSEVTSTSTIGGNLSVNNSALFTGDATDTDVTGTVSIDSDNANANTIHNATGAVTVSSGKLTMNDAEDDVTLITGTLTMNDATGAGATVKVESGTLEVNDVTHDLTVTGGTVTSAATVGGDLSTSNAGVVDEVGAVTGNMTLNNSSEVTATSTIGGNLSVNDSALFTGHTTNTDVTGTVSINSDNANASTLHNASGAVTVSSGTLTMNDATGAGATVKVEGGELQVNDVTHDLTVTGGTVTSAATVGGDLSVASDGTVTTIGNIGGSATLGGTSNATSTGTIGGNLSVNDSALFTGHTTNTDVTGTVSIDSDNAKANTIHNASGSVTVSSGKLNMNDAADDVTLTTGTLTMNDATGAAATVKVEGGALTVNDVTHDLTVTGGTVTKATSVGGNLSTSNAGVVDEVGAVTGNVTLSNSSEVTSTSTIGGNLSVNNSALFTGDATDTDVTGTVSIDSDNANANTLHNASGSVTVSSGTLTMNDAADDVTLTDGTLTMNDATGADATVKVEGGALEVNDVTHDLTVTGGTVTKATSVGGNLSTSNAGVVDEVGAVTGNVTLSNSSEVTSTSTIGGNLSVSNSALFTGHTTDTDVTGTVSIDSDNANANTIHNATGAVTVSSGKLTMNDAADDVTLTDGTLTMNDATGAAATVKVEGGALTVNDVTHDLTVTGGTVTKATSVGGDLATSGDGAIDEVGAVTGNMTLSNSSEVTSTSTIGGNLSVNNSALFTGDATDTDVTGTVSIDSDNANTNTIHNATGAVTVSSGKLTMNDATGAAATVKVEGGALTVNDVTHDLTVTGGTVTKATSVGGDLATSGDGAIDEVGAVTGNMTLSNSSEVTSTSTIGGNLSVNNSALFTGDATDTDVTGTVSIDSDNANTNTIHNATGAVTVSSGKLTMNDATGAAATVKVEGGALTVNDVTHDLTVTGGTVTKATSVGGDLATSGDGAIDEVGAVTGNMTLSNSSEVTSTSTIGGNLSVNNSALFTGDATDTDVTGTVSIDSDNANTNTIHNATGAVTVSSGKLTMNDATGAAATVKVEGGALTVNDVTHDLTVTGGTVTKATSVGGNLSTSNAGVVDEVGAVAGNVTLSNSSEVTSTSTIGGNLSVNNSALFTGDATDTDVTGTVNINTSNTDANIISNASSKVTLSKGTLIMNDAQGGLAITGGTVLSAGTITGNFSASNSGVATTIGNVTGNATLGGSSTATSTGTIGGNLSVNNSALFTGDSDATDVTGTVTIDSDNADANTIRNTTGAVTVSSGNLSMNDAADDVTLTTGALTMNNATGADATVKVEDGALTVNDVTHDLTVTGGIVTKATSVGGNLSTSNAGVVDEVGAVTGNVTLSNSSEVNATSTIGGNLSVNNSTLFTGDEDATDVTGTVSINTSNAGTNIIRDATDKVTLTKGKLSMNDANDGLEVTGGTLVKAGTVTGDFSASNAGVITTIGNVTGNATVGGSSTATSTGTIGGNLSVNNSALFTGDANATNVAGTVNIDSDNTNVSTIHNATGAMTISSGNLSMNDAADDVTITDGTLTMNDATGAAATVKVEGGVLEVNNVTHDLTVTGGTVTKATSVGGNLATSNAGVVGEVGAVTGNVALSNTSEVTATGTIGGNLSVSNSALFTGDEDATDVTGTVTINTSNAGTNIFHDASSKVTLSKGKLSMNDAKAGLEVTGGTLVKAGTVTGDFSSSNAGVITTIGNITGNATLAGDSTVTSTGTIGGNLSVSNASIFTGNSGVTDVTGTVSINTSNAGTNIIRDATDKVTLTKGKLTIRDAADDVTLATGTLTMNDATGAGATVKIEGGSLEANDIAGDAEASGGTATINSINGTLDLTNNADVSVATDIGGAINTSAASSLTFSDEGTIAEDISALGSVTVQKNRTFSKDVTINNLAIEGADTSITLTKGDLGAANVTTNKTDASHNIIVNVEQNISGDIGTSNNPLGSLILNADVTANITTDHFYSSITTNTDGEGSVVFDSANASFSSNLGSKDEALKEVSFDADTTFSGNIYANKVNIANTKAATFSGSVTTNDSINLAGATAKAIFDEGSIVSSIVKGNSGGLVEFAGNATINADLGEDGTDLSKVTFADNADKNVAISADIFASDIVINKGSIQLAKAAKLAGNIETNAATIKLADKALTTDGNLTLNGENTITFTITDSGSGSNMTGGNITINGDMTFASGASLTITPTDNRVFKSTSNARSFSLFTLNGGTVTGATGNIKISDSDNWEIELANNNITVKEFVAASTNSTDTVSQESVTQIKQTAQGVSNEQNITIITSQQTESLRKVAALLDSIKQNAAKVNETVSRIVKGSTAATVANVSSVDNTMSGVESSLNNRLIDISPNLLVGVSAGDDDQEKFGAWINPFYSKSNQDETMHSSGYSNESYGASLGFDMQTENDTIVGFALTASNSNIKHKNLKSGDRTRINSMLFSIYNMYNLTENWFAMGTATIATNRIHNHAKRVSSLSGYGMANSKYRSLSFSIKELFGYNYINDHSIITPMVGLKFNRINATSYKETGATIQNLDIATKASNRFEVIAGLKMMGSTCNLYTGATITPELHAFVNYSLSNQSQTPTVKIDDVRLKTSSSKAARARYNLGTSLASKYDSVSFSAGYDLNLSNKFVGHQGSMKVRVDF